MDQGKPVIEFEASVTSAASPDVVYGVLADPSTHLVWAGEQATQSFKLLTLEAPKGTATVGTRFTSTGGNSKDGSSTFHDESVVTEATAPSLFGFVTNSQLVRKHRKPWQVTFVHRYDVQRDGDVTRIGYTCRVYPVNYRPYWLHPVARPLTRVAVNKMVTKNLANLALMTEKATVRGVVR